MNKHHQHLLRHSILLQLEISSPGSLPLPTILQGVVFAGHKINTSELEKELQYLEDKKLLTTHPQTISPATLRYQLSAIGRDYLEEQSLI